MLKSYIGSIFLPYRAAFEQVPNDSQILIFNLRMNPPTLESTTQNAIQPFHIWLLLLALAAICVRFETARPQLFFKKGGRIDGFLKSSQALTKEFRPHILAINRHMAMVVYIIVETIQKVITKPVKFELEVFTFADGGTAPLNWAIDERGGKPSAEGDGQDIMIFLAGLSGGADNLYTMDALMEARRRGFKCVVLGFRGTAGLELKTPKTYSAVSIDDVAEPIDYIYRTYCERQGKSLVGYAVSLGANIMGLYLERSGSACPLKGCVLYAAAINFYFSVDHFANGCYGFYNWLFAKFIQANLTASFPQFERMLPEAEFQDLKERAGRVKNMLDFDELVTAPMFGFPSRADYYKAALIKYDRI